MDKSTWDTKFGVIAVGGAGSNVLTDNAKSLPYIHRTIAIDTDPTALHDAVADIKLLVGANQANQTIPNTTLSITNIHQIIDAVSDLDIVFIVAGMGGVTGTSISSNIAEILQNHNIAGLAVAIMPFNFEGEKHKEIALNGVKTLTPHVNGVFQISNETFANTADKNHRTVPLLKHASLAFAQFYQCIINTSEKPGIVGIDFADVASFMSNDGNTAFGYGSATGENSIETAIQRAIDHPLLTQRQLPLASSALIAFEINNQNHPIMPIICHGFNVFRTQLPPDTVMFWCAIFNPEINHDFRVTIMLSGISDEN
ncbi:hypothetical protein [Sulfuriferula nivalis]|uniref:Cell division protein FtsZ n=1 Tax=Sulfuriferula nivalis TaxID=2675298 RepID=A0A809S1B0_9PROT|nr:hypothetical protein [Sulfuriferula nivalis]BBP00338.1 cell division protein FtsZ [Sulfuriferula nivalis]BBP01055.1 cell division protein FtsZ [Sulfuriferula nivalis]